MQLVHHVKSVVGYDVCGGLVGCVYE